VKAPPPGPPQAIRRGLDSSVRWFSSDFSYQIGAHTSDRPKLRGLVSAVRSFRSDFWHQIGCGRGGGGKSRSGGRGGRGGVTLWRGDGGGQTSNRPQFTAPVVGLKDKTRVVRKTAHYRGIECHPFAHACA
jgi:hypothetical protein